MTRDEALGIVKYLADAYRQEITEGTVLVWLDHLRGVGVNAGMTTAHELAAASQFMPHPSEFLRHAARVARRQNEEQRQLPGTTEPRTGRERALAHVAALREIVAAAPSPLRSPAPTPERRRERVALTPCPYCTVVDGVRYCDGSIVDRHDPRRRTPDAPPPPVDPS